MPLKDEGMAEVYAEDMAIAQARDNRPPYQKMFDGKYVLADAKKKTSGIGSYNQYQNFYGIDIKTGLPFKAEHPPAIHWFTSYEGAKEYADLWNKEKSLTDPFLYVLEIRSI